ncbi:substrate-binding domain-containing protein [Aminobacter sp. SR38]|jgi:DNA-binding LacI/PurR family transcriptional regulator|uniref:LacI family DNA-binding transcriptional regulator n=1 Tax=Aminobacter sp. SR38 TaxID=2774562 RepID=UPI0017839A15|nr:substrate-binding domain-containing protein [Aminobacter sp. SR38]QOF69883.1 substrate-binding domain-containing protein [Aminobacter sp. SR38]
MSEMKPGRSFVSAQQVAELAGVSRSAVSRTFTDGASVSEATRKKVLEAAEQLGYHVNHLARSLIHEDSGIVCLIGADINTPYHSRLLDAITRRLQAINRVAMVINTSGDSDSVEAALRQTLNYRANATVVLSGTPPASLINTCINSGQHVILINRDDHLDGPESITVDNTVAAREAFHMLHRAGCRRIAVVSSQAGTPSLVARERGFEEAAREAGLAVSITRAGPTGYGAGFEAGRLLLSGSERPDAAFCVTDLLACGFMDAARVEFGMNVPADLCVVGFDDIEQASWASYQLTTFRQPIAQIAEHITTLLDSDNPDVNNGPDVINGHGAVSGGRVCFHAAPVWRRTVRPK